MNLTRITAERFDQSVYRLDCADGYTLTGTLAELDAVGLRLQQLVAKATAAEVIEGLIP